MAQNIYNKVNSFNIDSLNVEDFIIKYNTVNNITLEVIFNSNIKDIINKPYTVNISLVNPNDTSIVYASFTPSASDFGVTKNTIPIGGSISSYTQQIGYFSLRYIDKNHFNINNNISVSNTPAEDSSMQLCITINGVKKLFGIKKFPIFNSLSTPIPSSTFNYLQNYNLLLKGYYLENTDSVLIKLNNVDSVNMSLNSINNTSIAPTRVSNVDFVYTGSAQSSFSGTNAYTLTKSYNITSPLTSSLIIRKSSIDRVISNTSFLNSVVVGSNKLFGTNLKNLSAVTDTVYLDFPLLRNLASGLSITNISVTSTPNKVNFSTAPAATSLGSGKFKIDLSYSPTAEPNSTVATYNATITINLTHTSVGLITLVASGFVYTNTTG